MVCIHVEYATDETMYSVRGYGCYHVAAQTYFMREGTVSGSGLEVASMSTTSGLKLSLCVCVGVGVGVGVGVCVI